VDVEDFLGVWLRNKQSFNIICFYEELELPCMGNVCPMLWKIECLNGIIHKNLQVVPKDSGKIVGDVQILIHANH